MAVKTETPTPDATPAKPTPTPNQDAAVMKGSPEETPLPVKEDPPVSEKPIYSSPKGDFKTTEELVTYTKSLEQSVLDKGLDKFDADNAAAKGLDAKVAPESDGDAWAREYADKLLTNAPEAIKMMDERNTKKANVQEEAQKTTEKMWDEFYKENPVLQQHKKVVQFIMNDNWTALKDLSTNEAKKILAEKSTEFITDIANQTGGKITTLVAANTEGLGASGEPTPKPPEKSETKVSNFCDQVQAMQRKKFA